VAMFQLCFTNILPMEIRALFILVMVKSDQSNGCLLYRMIGQKEIEKCGMSHGSIVLLIAFGSSSGFTCLESCAGG